MEAVLESQAQLQALCVQRMDAFQAELQRNPASANTLTAEFTSFRVFVMAALKSLQDQIGILARESDSLEMRARRKILLIHGLPEDKKEDTTACIVKAVIGQLKVPEFSATDISRCHRMGRSSAPERPRPILLKVRDLSLRNKLWFAKTALKGTGITLSEFLTKPRHDAFMAARQRFGLNKTWTRDGFVFLLGSDGSRHRVSSITELEKIEALAPPKPVAAKESTVGAAAKTRRAAKK